MTVPAGITAGLISSVAATATPVPAPAPAPTPQPFFGLRVKTPTTAPAPHPMAAPMPPFLTVLVVRDGPLATYGVELAL